MWGTIRNATIIFVSVMVLGFALVVMVWAVIEAVDYLAAAVHETVN